MSFNWAKGVKFHIQDAQNVVGKWENRNENYFSDT